MKYTVDRHMKNCFNWLLKGKYQILKNFDLNVNLFKLFRFFIKISVNFNFYLKLILHLIVCFYFLSSRTTF